MIHEKIQKFTDAMQLPLLQYATSADCDHFNQVMPLMPYVIGELIRMIPDINDDDVYVANNITDKYPDPDCYSFDRTWTTIFYPDGDDSTCIEHVQLYPFNPWKKTSENDFQTLKELVANGNSSNAAFSQMLYINHEMYPTLTKNAVVYYDWFITEEGEGGRSRQAFMSKVVGENYRTDIFRLHPGLLSFEIPNPRKIWEITQEFKPMVRKLFG